MSETELFGNQNEWHVKIYMYIFTVAFQHEDDSVAFE